MRFADTSFWIALVRSRERHHKAAVAIQRRDAGPVVTSNLVLGETRTSFAVMRRRRIHEALAFDGDFSAAGYVEVRP